MSPARPKPSVGDRAFALMQEVLPKRVLSNAMHRLARSTRPAIRNGMIGAVLRGYPMIDMREAQQPDPYAYASFNEFFTRTLAPGARPVASGEKDIVYPVDGTISQSGAIDEGSLVQAKGIRYSAAALLADIDAPTVYRGGHFACLYLAPYNYHRIHMPIGGRLTRTRYVPGKFFSVSPATVRSIPNLFALNERVICEFETAVGPLAMVLVGAFFVGSIETVYAGEINSPPARGGQIREIEAGLGTVFERGEELGRFNMGSTVIVLIGNEAVRFLPGSESGSPVRMGERLARLL